MSGSLMVLLLIFLCVAKGEVYYVTPTVNIFCPGEPCLTISEYAAQPHHYFNSTTTLVFLQGKHLLSRTFTLHDLGILELTSHLDSEVSLECVLSNSLVFESVHNVSICGLQLFGCYGNRIEDVGRFIVDNSSLYGAQPTGNESAFYAVGVEEAILSDSFFSNWHGSQTTACSVLSVTKTTLSILNSRFTDNSAHEKGTMCAFNSHVTVTDSTFVNNTGGVIYAEHSTITAHRSKFTSNSAHLCSVVHIKDFSSLSLDSCSFDDNWSSSDGGVMCIKVNSTLMANYSIFQNNSAENAAGVLQLAWDSMATIYNSSFVSNHAVYGGVVSSFYGTRLEFVDSTFYNNSVFFPTPDGGYGAVMNTQDDVSIFLTGCRFVNNSASASGGCAHLRGYNFLHISDLNVFEGNRAIYGGAFTISFHSMINISSGGDCDGNSFDSTLFVDNSAQHGGALNIIENSDAHIHCSRFEGNTAITDAGRGGAILARTNALLNFTSASFSDNRAQGKGGIIFAQFASMHFEGLLTVEGTSSASGFVYITSCNVSVAGNSTFSNNQKSFLAHNSVVEFTGDVVFRGGTSNTREEGGALTAVRSTVSFRGNVLMESNYGIIGGALLVHEGILLTNEMFALSNNVADEDGGALYAYKTELEFKGHTVFDTNNASGSGGGMFAVSSRAQFYKQANFIGNRALKGGGVYLDQMSSLTVIKEKMECLYKEDWYCTKNTTNWAKLTFDGNHALEKGGAIYKNDSSATTCDSQLLEQNPTYKECFIQTIAVYSSASDWDTSDVHFANINFIDNSALVGELLYGGLLDRCAVDSFAEVKQILQDYTPHPFDYFSLIVSTNVSTAEIASDPTKICFCENGAVNCELPPPFIDVKRGQTFDISLTVTDQVGKPVSGYIEARLSSTSSHLGRHQSRQFVNATCSVLQYNVHSVGPETLQLYPEGPCTDHGISMVGVSINVSKNCPVGFSLSNSSLECVCDPNIKYFTNCSIDTESIVREGNFWISSVLDGNTSDIIAHDFCPYDYCYPPTDGVLVNLNQENGSNTQCAFYRSGRLCGSCQEGYSLTLGSSKCAQCSNYWLFLILPFALAGLGLVVLMMLCNLTLASGTINGVLFYANIMIANRATFFPYQQQNVLTVFVSWLGLNLGIATCFYDGMDGFGKTWVQISFEVYLIMLVFVVIAFGRNTKIAALFHHYKLHPVHTLATLVLLSYEKLSRRIFSLLAFTYLRYPNENKQVWLFDPNLAYMEGKFISLAIVAAFIIVAGITLNFLLLFSKFVISKLKYPSIINFLEAFHAPFKPKHKYWIGLLLFIQNVSSFTSQFANAGGNPDYNLHFVFVLLIGLLTLKLFYVYSSGISLKSLRGYRRLVSSEEPSLRGHDDVSDTAHEDAEASKGIVYKSLALDSLETSFLVNLSLLMYFTVYFRDSQRSQSILFYFSASVVLVVFVGIVIYHVCVYSPFSLAVKKLMCKCRKKDSLEEVEEATTAKPYGSTDVTPHQPTKSVLTTSFAMS